MKKIVLTIDGKSVEITENNVFSVIDMIMAAGQAMHENKNFSRNSNGVAMTFSATTKGAANRGDELMKKIDALGERVEQFSAKNNKKVWL